MGITIDVLKSLLKKPFTRRYPKEKLKAYPRFLGRIHYFPERCIGCRSCERYCPVGAVKFYEKGKIEFDLGLCIFCGMCRDVCPASPKAIKLSGEFELADKDKNKAAKNVVDE
jgi:formate hydrogenlyase subunit 6